MSLDGSCLCEAVTVHIKDLAPVADRGLEICHCTDCRKATGGIAGYLLFGTPDNIIIKGDTKEFAHAADSGNILYRRYCVNCGSPVCGNSELNKDEELWVNVGLFPPGTLPAPGDELYLRNKEKWYNTYSSAKHWDEMPSE